MNISVFGLGYVGCVTAACLADSGHEVWGVDVSADKIDMVNGGKSPIVEHGLDEMIPRLRTRGLLRATADFTAAVLATDLSLICVGTPGQDNGRSDLRALGAVAQQIGSCLPQKKTRHSIVLRSTVPPGTIREHFVPALERAAGLRGHRDFDVCMNPEFLREGTAVSDFYHPPLIVIGEATPEGGDLLACMYEGIDAPLERTSYEVAELLKYACNAFHATKVAFANEIGALCKELGVDSHRVMKLFALDTKLNISPAYLRPGFAFGGSCLPKDLRALVYAAKHADLTLPLLGSVLDSNRLHLERVIARVLGTREKRVGILGLSFKPGTDDLRESPSVALIETLIGKGCQVKVYDPDVLLARLVGANKRFIEREIPHISQLMCTDLDEVVADSEVIVVSKASPEFTAAVTPHLGTKFVFDLARLPLDGPPPHRYEGICW
jgi:GDP-mannose 6-dehydrogenase